MQHFSESFATLNFSLSANSVLIGSKRRFLGIHHRCRQYGAHTRRTFLSHLQKRRAHPAMVRASD